MNQRFKRSSPLCSCFCCGSSNHRHVGLGLDLGHRCLVEANIVFLLAIGVLIGYVWWRAHLRAKEAQEQEEQAEREIQQRQNQKKYRRIRQAQQAERKAARDARSRTKGEASQRARQDHIDEILGLYAKPTGSITLPPPSPRCSAKHRSRFQALKCSTASGDRWANRRKAAAWTFGSSG